MPETFRVQSKFSGEERFHASPLICSDRFEINRSKDFVRPEAKLLRLAGEVARRAGGVSHPRIIPQGKQKGRYAPARRTKRPLRPSARRTKRSLWPRGCETPSAPSGLVPLRGGTVLASAWKTKRPLWPPHGKQKGCYVPRRIYYSQK